jgi:hypothetical protein
LLIDPVEIVNEPISNGIPLGVAPLGPTPAGTVNVPKSTATAGDLKIKYISVLIILTLKIKA